MFNMNSLGAFASPNRFMHYHHNSPQNTGSKLSNENGGFKLETVAARHVTVKDDGFVVAGEELCEELQKRFQPAIKFTLELVERMRAQLSTALTHTQNNGLDKAANSISLVPGMRINMGNGDFIDIYRFGVRFNNGSGPFQLETSAATNGLNHLIRWANGQLTYHEGMQLGALSSDNPATVRATLTALQRVGIDTSRPFTINGTRFEVRNGLIVTSGTMPGIMEGRAAGRVADKGAAEESRLPASIHSFQRRDGSFISVHKADCFSTENPTYRVIGNDKNGEFDIIINVGNVNPLSASYAEMVALQSHLLLQGKIGSVVPFFPQRRADDGTLIAGAERFSAHTKMNFVAHFNGMLDRNANNPWSGHVDNITRLIRELEQEGGIHDYLI